MAGRKANRYSIAPCELVRLAMDAKHGMVYCTVSVTCIYNVYIYTLYLYYIYHTHSWIHRYCIPCQVYQKHTYPSHIVLYYAAPNLSSLHAVVCGHECEQRQDGIDVMRPDGM